MINVNVLDYAQLYAEETLLKYVNENIKNYSSQIEQFTAITDYISKYSYNPEIGNYIHLVILKSGNSSALSSAIDFMAKSIGIKSHIRVSENDDDKEVILRSVIALIDNEFYISKILFNESLVHNYSIYKIPQGYSYRKSEEDENSIIIYQYDGYEEEINIPGVLDNKKVIGLDKKCFYNGVKFTHTNIKKISIPESIISIGDGTFSELLNLTEITIPKSVKYIGYRVFEGSNKIENINVDKENTEYSSEEGVLYNKNKNILINYPPGKKNETFNTSEILEKIENYSFYRNHILNKIYCSKSINYIGKNAFGNSSIEEIYFKGDPPIIGEDAFLFLNVTINYPKNNKKWTYINNSNYGSFNIAWKEIDIDENREDIMDNNTILWVLIIFGDIIIILVIIFIIIIKRKDKDKTSNNIETIGRDGLLKEQNKLS